MNSKLTVTYDKSNEDIPTLVVARDSFNLFGSTQDVLKVITGRENEGRSMTVEQPIEILETLPKGSIITNEENSELAEVCCEPSEKYPYDLEVWMVFEGEI